MAYTLLDLPTRPTAQDAVHNLENEDQLQPQENLLIIYCCVTAETVTAGTLSITQSNRI